MITEITDETTVKELKEILHMVNTAERNDNSAIFSMWENGGFTFRQDNKDRDFLCTDYSFDYYMAKVQKKTELNKFMSISDDEFSEYVYKILEDPKKSEILFDAIKEVLK